MTAITHTTDVEVQALQIVILLLRDCKETCGSDPHKLKNTINSLEWIHWSSVAPVAFW